MRNHLMIVALVLAGACGGSSGGGGSVSLEQLPMARAKAVCPQNLKCCSADEIQGRTEKDCEDSISGNWTFLVATLGESVQKGRLVYHGDKMGACLAAEAALGCDAWKAGADLLDPPASCSESFEGKVEVDGACSQDLECKSRHCEGAVMGQGTPKDGKCIAAIATNADCTATPDACADANYCDGETNKCLAKKAVDVACQDDEQCTSQNCGASGKCESPHCYVECSVGARPSVSACATSLLFLALGLGMSRRRSRLPRRPSA